MLAYLGVCAAILAGQASPLKLGLVMVTVFIASAGANGLTNYLDREIDARMERTCHRALPSKRIYPSQKVLPFLVSLIVIGLALAWLLSPFAFAADAIGTLVAATWRKKVTCIYPQGMIASCAPLLMGWFAVTSNLNWEVLFLCIMIALWLPLHVWSLIISNREDFLQAGLTYFPINRQPKDTIKVILLFSLALYGASLALYFIGNFNILYLVIANLLGMMILIASIRLVVAGSTKAAWTLYKISTVPYLGIIFFSMILSKWV